MADVAVRNYRMSRGHHRQNSEKQNYSYTSGRGNPCAQKYQRKNPSWSDQNRPTFFRLDSTGENSGSSCEDLNGAISPEIQQASNRCQPRFKPQDNTCTHQGVGLLDKVKSAFGASNQTWNPPRRETTRNLMQSQGTLPSSPDSHLATLDSVAEKLTNMSMPKHPPHWGNPMANSQQSSQRGPPRHNAQGQWGRTFVPQDRGHAPIFHPYQGMNQSPFLASTQNYQRNFYSSNPWHQMMDGNNQCHPPFDQGFHHFAPPPPPFPWQQLLGPQMMQGFAHQGPMNRNQWARSPPKKPKWNNGHGSRQRTFPQSKPKSQSRCRADHSSSSVTSSSETCVQISSQIRSCIDKTVDVHVQINTSEVKSDETLVTADCGSEEFIGHVVDSCAINSQELAEDLVKTCQSEERAGIAILSDRSKSNTSCLLVKANEKNVAVQGENCQTTNERKDGSKKNEESEFNERHSSIELILADYKVQSSTQDKEMALSSSSDPESGSDSDSAVEANADLWESFTASDDPYNPLCGWRCSDSIQQGHPGKKSSFQDCHIDSGTDEGDNWSETDSDDDYDSGDDSPVDDVDTGLPRSFKLSNPQLQELRDSLSSTPKEKPDSASGHHPSVAFILGSTSSSSDDDDDDWDTLDDPSTLEDDPLWDSFNRARDPYSPMEAWKCHDSNLSSTVPAPSPSTPMRKDSVEGQRTLLLASTEQKETLPQICEGLPSRDSDVEIFDIATIRVHGARDDIDLGSPTVAEGSMKRVASASCLRRYQLTPQDKAFKKVRFCPDSSFIVLVEKDPASCETNPTQASENDWQACARDRMRFKARIDQLCHVLDPVLTNTHREQVYASRMAEGEDR